MENMVSVAIPAYNHENFIKETINSIINQTYKNIELIILDDGSSDLTWQKINELKDICEKRFVKTHFEKKENEGICETLNKLIKLTEGEYVYFIASDDIAKPNAIEEEVNFLKSNPDFSLVVGNNEIIDSDGDIAYWDKKRNLVYEKSKAKYITFCDMLMADVYIDFSSSEFGTYETLFKRNYIPNGYLIRKSIFDTIEPFTPEAPLADWFLMLQISKYAKMKFLNKILYSYRWHSDNTIKDFQKMRKDYWRTQEYELKLLEKIDNKKLLPSALNVKNKELNNKKPAVPFILQLSNYEKTD